ncbi:MAG: hypothetical protein K6A98_02980 [Prevotella sp.]|nr:hypothetical protein [Prevotella sp.]
MRKHLLLMIALLCAVVHGAWAQDGFTQVVSADALNTAINRGSNTPTNTATIVENYGNLADGTIRGRRLYKDGSWNTLCLPFDVSLEGSPFEGASVMELDVDGMQTGYDDASGTLYLYFKEATKIEAGVPYIVKWVSATTNNNDSPTINGSSVNRSSPRTITSNDGAVSFVGTFSPVSIGEGGDNTILYLGEDNLLHYPNAAMSINAFRAYFQLNNGLTAGEPGSSNGVRFMLNFGDENTENTGIISIENSKLKIENGSGAVYDLQGRRVASSIFNLQSSMLKKGVYIINGKKRVIK